MRKTAILISLSFLFTSCTNQNQPTTQATNSNLSVQRSNDSLVVSSHSTERSATPVSPMSPSSSSSQAGNSPMAKAIDVSEMTANIEKSEKAYKANSNDPKAKSELADAYFARAFSLTEASQYRAALGHYRKGLKLNPNAKEAKSMHDRIISIFQSINREPPKEGEEPPPMPFDKKA